MGVLDPNAGIKAMAERHCPLCGSTVQGHLMMLQAISITSFIIEALLHLHIV
jgi:hypothetical protein